LLYSVGSRKTKTTTRSMRPSIVTQLGLAKPDEEKEKREDEEEEEDEEVDEEEGEWAA